MSSIRFKTESDLISKGKELENLHLSRKTIHQKDHSLWRLDEYILDEVKANSLLKKENWPSFTSNAPRTLSRVVSAMLNKNDIKLKTILPKDVPESEEDLINKNERLINGAIYEQDQIRLRRGDTRLQWSITWYIIHRGGVVVSPLWIPEDSRNQWKIRIFDPYDCVWEPGSDCLDFFAHHYWGDKAALESEWNVSGLPEDANGLVECWDFWWIDRNEEEAEDEQGIIFYKTKNHAVFNAVVCGTKFVKEPTYQRDFECVPVYVVTAGGYPGESDLSSGSSNKYNVVADKWEGLYSGLRETNAWLNRSVTLFGLYLRNGAIGPYLYKGRQAKNIEKALGPFKIIKIGEKEEFGPTALPPMANEAKQFLAYIQQEWQKAGVADIVFGDVPFTVSGFGMLQLRGAVEILINSFVRATQDVYVIIADELTKQFVKIGRNRKINIKGFDGRDKEFMDKISPKDISKQYIITASLNEGLPRDPVQMGNAATLWRNAGAPVHKIFEDVFEFDDSAELARQVLREKAEQLPPVLIARMIAALIAGGDLTTAALITEFASKQGISGQAGNIQTATGPQAENPSNANANPQFVPPELAGTGEQAGQFPTQPTGRPPGG